MLLYDLIHSLSGTEKSYFVKQFSSNDHSYAQLFRIIVNQKKCNEDLIKKEFEKTNSKNSYAYIKNYLYHSILRSCIQYRSMNKNVHYYISVISHLYDRGLYDHVIKIMKAAFKEARAKVDYLSLLKLVEFSKNLIYRDVDDKILQEIIQLEETFLNNLNVISTFQDFYDRARKIAFKNGGIGAKWETQELKSIQNHNYLQDVSNCVDKKCEYYYYSTQQIISLLLSDESLRESSEKGLIKILKDKSYKKVLSDLERFRIYMLIISNRARMHDNKFVEEYVEYYEKELLSSTSLRRREKVRGIIWCMILKMHLYRSESRLKEAQLYNKEIQAFVKKNVNFIPQVSLVTIDMYDITLAFELGQFKEMSNKIDSILTKRRKHVRTDMRVHLLLFETIRAFEENKPVLFESRFISFKQFLSKSKVNDVALNAVASFFSEIIRGKEMKKSAKALLQILDLERSKRTDYNSNFLNRWIEGKISAG